MHRSLHLWSSSIYWASYKTSKINFDKWKIWIKCIIVINLAVRKFDSWTTCDFFFSELIALYFILLYVVFYISFSKSLLYMNILRLLNQSYSNQLDKKLSNIAKKKFSCLDSCLDSCLSIIFKNSVAWIFLCNSPSAVSKNVYNWNNLISKLKTLNKNLVISKLILHFQ